MSLIVLFSDLLIYRCIQKTARAASQAALAISNQERGFAVAVSRVYLITSIVDVSLICPKNASPLVENPILGYRPNSAQ